MKTKPTSVKEILRETIGAEAVETANETLKRAELTRWMVTLRSVSGLTIEDVAQRMGVDPAVVERIEGSLDTEIPFVAVTAYLQALEKSLHVQALDATAPSADLIKAHRRELLKHLKITTDLIKGDPKLAKGVFDFIRDELIPMCNRILQAGYKVAADAQIAPELLIAPRTSPSVDIGQIPMSNKDTEAHVVRC